VTAISSSLTWLDYSEHERRKVLDVIRALGERDTRDELGVGAVRDAFADALFPGTSTIETRARYFLFVPWVYRAVEAGAAGPVSERARNAELDLIGPLQSSDDNEGTIGSRAQRHLQRLPSSVYWLGLERWGIRLFGGSQSQYHSMLDRAGGSRRVRRNDDGEPVDGSPSANWHRGIPDPPGNFPRGISFRLAFQEAAYLRERIMTHCHDSLLAFLVDRGCRWESVGFAWEHPQLGEFPATTGELLDHARAFSEVFHGAALLYNLMLAQLAERGELVRDYQQRLAKWGALLEVEGHRLASWDRGRFWQLLDQTEARITPSTRRFVTTWLDLALGGDESVVRGENVAARTLIHLRERDLKRGQARLDSRRALEMWGGEAGTGRLTYRWPVAQRITLDILAGLEAEASRA
jgi:hypothetical protein